MATFQTSTWIGESSGGDRKYRVFMEYTETDEADNHIVTVTKLGIEQTTSGTSNWTGGTAWVQIEDGGYHSATKKTRALGSDSWTWSGSAKKTLWSGTITWTYPKQSSSYIVSFKLSGGKSGGSAFTGNANKTASMTIPAKANPITISFSGNGGSGYMSPISCYQGDTIEMPGCEFTRQGSSFSYWWSSSGSYTPGQTYIVGSSNATFYAEWITGYVAPQITGAAAYRVSSSASGVNPTSISNGTRGFMKICIEGGEGYTLRTVSMTIANRSITPTRTYDSATGKYWYVGYTSNNVMSAQTQYDAVCNYSVLTDNGDVVSYTYRTIVSKDQFVIDVRADGKALGLLTEADESASTPQVDVGGTLKATTLKQGDQNVSVQGHTHTKSEITDFPSIPSGTILTSSNYSSYIRIQSGSVVVTPTSSVDLPWSKSGYIGTATIYFSGFSSAPNVVACADTSTPHRCFVGVTSITSSSATIYFTRTTSTATTIRWIAYS